MADGYLPALTTSFTRDNVSVSITDFADQQTIAGNPVELVYTRVSVTNNGAAAVSVPSGQSGPGLVELDSASDTVAPGATVRHDFVAAVDTFGSGASLPTTAEVTSDAAGYAATYAHMTGYWNNRLSAIPRLSLPNVTLPDTANLADPGTAIDNACKAAFVYTRIVQSGTAPFSGANNYDWLLNHDLPGILDDRFELGDFKDAQNLLLVGRISEASNFNELGANWYWDGPWRTPLAWAEYLEMTGDTAFVSKYFHDDANGPSPWGPSLYTLMHTDWAADRPIGDLHEHRSHDAQGSPGQPAGPDRLDGHSDVSRQLRDRRPGQQETTSWQVTPAAGADGGYGLITTAGYAAPDSASSSVSAQQWVVAQPPLPVPAGQTDVALTGTVSASYASPWTSVSAVNSGLYPPESHDTTDPYWGTWPEQGTQYLQLTWAKPVTVSGSSVYFWSDGSGVLPPQSWTIQYWNGSAWADVTNASSYGTNLNAFNTVTFDPVSTTQLRAVFDTGYTGTCTGACHAVGVIQWVADGNS